MVNIETVPEFHPSELTLIDQYRRSKNTAVLTILFTDIKGFTEITEKYGETFSNDFRRAHDAILQPIIERDGGGRVIKHIGDSIMAVFSEPSTAVARSLEIQQAIRDANKKAAPGHPPLSVRIGLHTGQVTTEDQVSLDVFGRHVNRAARVQSLADGGQILMTYPVFDSAKGWLTQTGPTSSAVSWQEHGRYKLKGIPEEIQIFEAYDPALVKPVTPDGAIVSASPSPASPGKSLRTFIAAMAVLLLAAGIPGYYFLFCSAPRPAVSLVDFTFDDNTYIDDKPILVGGQKTDHIRPLLTELKPGRHLLYNDISPIVRNFKPLDLKPGANTILDQGYTRVELPGISRQLTYDPTGKNSLDESNETEFSIFPPDDPNWPKKIKGTLNLKINASPSATDPKQIDFKFTWTISEDGKVLHQDSKIITTDLTSVKDLEPFTLFKSSVYVYRAKLSVNNGTASGDIEANFFPPEEK